jgi:hypothetical protein
MLIQKKDVFNRFGYISLFIIKKKARSEYKINMMDSMESEKLFTVRKSLIKKVSNRATPEKHTINT